MARVITSHVSVSEKTTHSKKKKKKKKGGGGGGGAKRMHEHWQRAR